MAASAVSSVWEVRYWLLWESFEKLVHLRLPTTWHNISFASTICL